MFGLGRAVFALLMLAAPILLADDLDEFEAMMAEPAERRGWIDPMDMGLENSGVGQSCDLGAVGKELQVCKEALRRALERNETTSKPVQETSTTDAFLKRHVSHLLQRLGVVSGQPAHLKVEIQLSSLDASLLKNFIAAKPASNVHDVVDVLGRMIKEVESYEKSPVLETIKVEMRVSLQLAELEREGGFSPHVSPFVEVRDLGGLLSSNGFSMLTIDTDDLKVRYPSMFPLFADLKGMAESSAAINRKLHLHRETLLAANAVYEELYGEPGQVGEGQAAIVLPATFQVYYWIGWKPDKSQPKPLKPQKSDVSLKDLYKLDELAEKKGVTDLNDDGDPKKS